MVTITECYGLIVYVPVPPPNLFVEILSPNLMILEGGIFGIDQVMRALLCKRPQSVGIASVPLRSPD